MANNLNNDQRNLIIDFIKQRPYIYDTNHHNYRNVKIKKEAWKDIAGLCKAQVKTCKRFWKSVRDQYQRYQPESGRKPYRYLSKLSFLDGYTKKPKTTVNPTDEDSKEVFVQTLVNSPNSAISCKSEPEDNNACIEENTTEDLFILSEVYNKEECENNDFTSKQIPTSHTNNNTIYCNNYLEMEERKSANDLCNTINNVLEKHFNTEDDDNEIFLEMIGKKMKCLPLTVKNRLQGRFLQEVNNEIQKLH